MKIILNIISKTFIFIFLTIITQVGGVIYLISLMVAKKWHKYLKFKILIIFLSLYLIFSFLIIPSIAQIFGREKIKNSEKIKPTNYLTILLNRNYVNPRLNKLLSKTAKELQKTDIEIHYLDANFPFINKFPLFPHLSHNDGKKIDISFIYTSKQGVISNKQKSISGYGVFEEPKTNEYNQTKNCLKQGYFQYDYSKYLTLGKINHELVFSEKHTKILIEKFLKNNELGKLFIEPHLKTRMNLTNKKVRFQGCRAVRHDDHIHIQLK